MKNDLLKTGCFFARVVLILQSVKPLIPDTYLYLFHVLPDKSAPQIYS